MKRANVFVALTAGALILATSSASAQSFSFGFGTGRGWGWGRGFGRPFYRPFYRPFGFGYRSRTFADTTYRNAFTADVTHVERAVNHFRSAYEKRGGDPIRVKTDIQRMDEAMERLRREAENFGGATIRGSELFRIVQSRAQTIERGFADSDDSLKEDWRDIRRLLDWLAPNFRRR